MQIRWLIRRDMKYVIDIDKEICGDWYNPAWSDEDYLAVLRQRNCIGMVIEQDEEIVGYMIYELHKDLLKLVRITVKRDKWGAGVFATMINRLKDKLSQQRRRQILVEVPEYHMDLQLAFKSLGFKAVCVIKDDVCDMYTMVYKMPAEAGNRISEYYTEDSYYNQK